MQATSSMSSTDATEDLVAVLRGYFSAPLARALLTATLRRAKLPHESIERRGVPAAVGALEEILPNYIADAKRRADCLRALRLVTGASTPPSARAELVREVSTTASAATIIHLRTPDDVVNACEVGRDIARKVGFSDVDQVKVATATAELTRNALVYAKGGEMRVTSLDAPRRGIEIEVTDRGSGIDDLELVMSERYRSRTGMGMGLKGAKRLMDVFEISSSHEGTRVFVRKFVR